MRCPLCNAKARLAQDFPHGPIVVRCLNMHITAVPKVKAVGAAQSVAGRSASQG